MKCQHCGKAFTPAPWPATRAKYCSSWGPGNCRVASWLKKHREKLNARSRAWYASDVERGRAVKRRWNNTPHGVERRRQWQLAHHEAQYTKAKANGLLEKVRARALSRKLLIATGKPIVCSARGEHHGRIECHHKDENVFNTKLSNLRWLCKQHHARHHRKPLPPLS